MIRKSLLKKNKKGSHIGIIVSFTLFITSILFLYTMIGSPIKFTKEKERAVYSLKENFIKYAQEEAVVARFYANNSCFQFSKPINLPDETNVFAISNNVEIKSSFSGEDVLVSSSNGLTKIYFTRTALEKNLTGEVTPPCQSIEAKSIVYKKMIIENKILEIINESINNESNLRENLKISNDDEFNLIFIYPNGTEVGEKKKEIKGNIYARKFLIDYLSRNGLESIGELEIRIW